MVGILYDEDIDGEDEVGRIKLEVLKALEIVYGLEINNGL